jgi:hypothetical protein
LDGDRVLVRERITILDPDGDGIARLEVLACDVQNTVPRDIPTRDVLPRDAGLDLQVNHRLERLDSAGPPRSSREYGAAQFEGARRRESRDRHG